MQIIYNSVAIQLYSNNLKCVNGIHADKCDWKTFLFDSRYFLNVFFLQQFATVWVLIA